MIDLSHTSHATQRHVLAISEAPVIFSHSSWYVTSPKVLPLPPPFFQALLRTKAANPPFAPSQIHPTLARPSHHLTPIPLRLLSHALRPHPRNVPDDVLALLKRNNGLIMICFLPSLVRQDENPETTTAAAAASVADVADHVVHAGKKMGYGHVGIGSDFDGMLEGPRGLDGVGDFPALVAELVARGVADGDMQQLCGGNLIRVLGEVERFSQSARAREMAVLCDEVEEVWTREQREMIVATGVKRGARLVH